MFKLTMAYLKDTKSCYVFQRGERGGEDYMTLYLKKQQVDGAGIDPHKGITVTVEEGNA